MDDVEQQVDAVLQKRNNNYRKSKGLSPRTKFLLLCVVMLSLGTITVLPLFDDKSLLSHIETILESKADNNPLVAAQPLNGSAYNYWYAPQNSMGIKSMKSVNFTFWKSWLKKYFSYQLEARQNNESAWQNANELLNVSLLFNTENNTCKATLTLNTTNAPASLYYRFTMVANRSVISHVNKSTNYTYVLNLSANTTENYSLVYNYSDLVPYIQSGVINIKQGIWNNYFYQRIKTNKKIAVNRTIIIDPYLGDTTAYGTNWGMSDDTCWTNYSKPANDGTVDNVTAYFRSRVDGETVQCGLYFSDNMTQVANGLSDVLDIDNEGDSTWHTWVFSAPKPVIHDEYNYSICFGTTSANLVFKVNDALGYGAWDKNTCVGGLAWPDPLVVDTKYTYTLSAYVNYTILAGGKSWQQNYSGYWTGGNTSAWTQNFTGYWTGGNDTVSWQQNYTGYWTGGNISSWIQNYSGYWIGGNVSANETWQQNFTGYWTGGNDSVDWNQNFTGYWTGGNATVSWTQNFTGYWTGGNGSAWTQNFTGYWTGGNATVSWTQNFTGYWTGGNVSETWQQNFTGWWTGGNYTADAFNITLEFPVNESNIYSIQPTVYFNLTHPDGYTMNYSLYIHNTTWLYDGVNVSNGTQVHTSHLFYSANTTYETYYWRVVVNDGMGNWVNETYNFQAVLQGGGGITGNGAALAIATGAIMFSVIGIFGIYEKKRRNR